MTFPFIHRKKGFTILELLLVLFIIGILLSVVLASFTTARAKARDKKRQTDLVQIQLALEMYYNKYSRYPLGASNSRYGASYGNLGTFVWSTWPLTEFLPKIPVDPINTQTGGYFYSYGAGYRKTGPTTVVDATCPTISGVISCQDYILEARLENYQGPDFGWFYQPAYFENYLLGSGDY